jgi:hypothetical protein
MTGLRLRKQIAQIAGRFEESELAVLDRSMGGRRQVLRRPEKIRVCPCEGSIAIFA